MNKRLDHWLVELNLVPSRTKAQELIVAGKVSLNDKILTKSNLQMNESQAQEIFVRADGLLQFVSRGGLKLLGAIEHLQLNVNNMRVMDIGSSTGGFSHCLLEQGATEVLGIDVGHDQLHTKLQEYENFKNIEGLNIKDIEFNSEVQKFLERKLNLVVADLSFISIGKVLPFIAQILPSGAKALVLVKPQFELANESLNKKGVVKDQSLYSGLEQDMKKVFSSQGFDVIDYFPSALRGKDGNQEFFLYATKL